MYLKYLSVGCRLRGLHHTPLDRAVCLRCCGTVSTPGPQLWLKPSYPTLVLKQFWSLVLGCVWRGMCPLALIRGGCAHA